MLLHLNKTDVTVVQSSLDNTHFFLSHEKSCTLNAIFVAINQIKNTYMCKKYPYYKNNEDFRLPRYRGKSLFDWFIRCKDLNDTINGSIILKKTGESLATKLNNKLFKRKTRLVKELEF